MVAPKQGRAFARRVPIRTDGKKWKSTAIAERCDHSPRPASPRYRQVTRPTPGSPSPPYDEGRMRRFTSLLAVLAIFITSDARAFFFIFIPSSLTSKLGDAITGAEGENCVASTLMVGDKLTLAAGNTAIVKSLSGNSSRCSDTRYPVRASLAFDITVSSNAALKLPEGYVVKSISDAERFDGTLVHAENYSKRSGVIVSAIPRTPLGNAGAIAQCVAASISSRTNDAESSPAAVTEVNGLRALRFEVEATNRGMYRSRYTHVVTVIEGATEIVVVDAYALTFRINEDRQDLQQIAFAISGVAPGVEYPSARSDQAQTVESSCQSSTVAGKVDAERRDNDSLVLA